MFKHLFPKKTTDPAPAAGSALRCSFCSKAASDVAKLIAGPTVFICDECVAICNEILADDARFEALAGVKERGPAPVPDVSRPDGARTGRTEGMRPKGVTPILNVSDIQQSFAWFEKLGWEKGWDWGSPPTFGGVCAGECEIFLCLDGQGGRGKSTLAATFGPDGDDAADLGMWMSIWVDDVDAVHRRCLEQGLEITWPPTDMPWNVREMHVRHPDGHVFRISQSKEED
jgi:catechol 2,3-dioxygenase-like lactoylglutathione lyase family enzyme